MLNKKGSFNYAHKWDRKESQKKNFKNEQVATKAPLPEVAQLVGI